MDEQEARAILTAHLRDYRRRSYAELKELLRSQEISEITGDSGTRYQLEFLAVWDDRPGGNLRVLGGIDDGGLRASFPLTDDFIVAPDGTFVGERGAS